MAIFNRYTQKELKIKKTILLLGILSCLAFAQSDELKKIDSKCSDGSSNEMAMCYGSEEKKLTNKLKAKIKTIKETFVDSSLAVETQPIWEQYTQKWCEGRKRLSRNYGYMIFSSCMIEHTLLRIEQLDIYYCNENGCPLTK